MLENTQFVEAHKARGLEYQVSASPSYRSGETTHSTVHFQHVLAYTELFNYLHHSPFLLAQSLSIGDRLERISSDQLDAVVRTIATGLYGNVILSKDVDMVLRLLRDLIEIQIVGSDSPRLLLRKGKCAFSRLYNRLHESLFSAKLFLTAALHEPIMAVLIEDESMLDIDAAKVVKNLPAKERLRRFGHEGTDEYRAKFREFCRETVDALYGMAQQFIRSLADHWALFPSTLRWVVQTMYHLLKSARIHDKDLNYILTDMVFANFICPAIVSPDLYGVSDAPISENARFNLMQIGQIVQMLSLVRHEDVEAKYAELFELFDRNVIGELMDQLLETECDIRVSTIAIPHQNDFGRVHVLVTQHELNNFVDFFRNVLDSDELEISGEDRCKLGKILNQLPDKWETIVNGACEQNGASAPPADSQSKTRQLLNLGKTTKNKLAKTISLNVTTEGDEAGACIAAVGGLNNNNYGDDSESVLMVRIAIHEESKFQLLTEQEVLSMNNICDQDVPDPDKVNDDAFDGLSEELPTRKHTRFSLSQDDQSLGNSDNLEVVSEAPSNHSVTSSMELEEIDQNLNDNLSDMVSANVSGRGSPNISGRDTPSSQVTEGDNAPIPEQQMAKILSKARSDIDEKFCKFEINKQIGGDETVSIISDTWSTDVLASDSETLEPTENERNFSTPLIPSAVVLPGDNNFNPMANSQLRANYLDASDTRSESAWSTDVLASDSEKMAEVDTDDNQSIAAKSDITDAGRSECDPIPDLIPTHRRAPDSPFFTPRNPSVSFRAPDSPLYTPRPPDSPLFSGLRNGNGSPRFSGSDDYIMRFGNGRPKRYSDNATSSFRSYRTNDINERENFLAATTTPMRRQNSAESSISNQSSQLDDAAALNKSKRHSSHKKSSDYAFGDYSRAGSAVRPTENIVKTSTDIINPFADDEPSPSAFASTSFASNEAVSGEDFSADNVERRHISTEQRNVSYDGRRNGVTFSGASASVTSKRLVSSLTYENHEIIIRSSKTHSLQMLPHNETSATDDDKNKQQDALLLVQKTLSMSLTDAADSSPLVDLSPPEEPENKPPPKYTGAIPKSISFDSSADKTGGASATHHHSAFRQNGAGFFNKIKQGFKNRRGNKPARGAFEEFVALPMPNAISRGSSTDAVVGTPITSLVPPSENGFNDTTEDILAKYRRKISSSSEATNSDSIGNAKGAAMASEKRLSNISHEESMFLYVKAKQKLRLVLSTTDLHTADFRHTNVSLPSATATCAGSNALFPSFQCHKTPPLLTYLQIQLAQALNLQNLQQIAYVSEAIRCVNQLDANQQLALIRDLQSDLVKRQSYLQYLMRYRQTLLSALENIDRFEDRLRNDREMCNRHLVMVCVRMFLKKREASIARFQDTFAALTVFDEKIECMIKFMDGLLADLRADGVLHDVADVQLLEARSCIERILLQRLYRLVMFPNDDADVSRDE